jgi:Phage protein Gp19/Gp15/Gp42
MANPAHVTDIENRWRALSPDEANVAEALLTDAWAMALVRVPTLEARLADESLSTALVVAVICAMVLRVMRNPDGKVQEAIDDYSYTRDSSLAAGLLYLGPDELALLSPGGDSSEAFTITPVGSPGYATNVPLNWWELNLS